MQIIFQTQNPKLSKGCFVYERTNSPIEEDDIEKNLCILAERLSISISSHPFKIEKYPNISIDDFNSEMFHSQKSINLIFRTFNQKEINKIDEEKIISINIYFDSADKEYLDRIIELDQYFSLTKESFKLLNTLITN